jgi:hypothetical protein
MPVGAEAGSGTKVRVARARKIEPRVTKPQQAEFPLARVKRAVQALEPARALKRPEPMLARKRKPKGSLEQAKEWKQA